MGRAPCCTKVGLHRGPWTAREDRLLTNYIHSNGEGHWRSLPKNAGLLRCGKSCRLRWMNYLRPGIKRGNITPDEDDLIIRLHSLLGNRWSLIAGRLPGRTDNEIKNYWNSHLSKRFKKPTTKEAEDDQPRKLTGKKIPDTQNQASENGETRNSFKIHQPKAVRVSSSVLSESRNTSRIGGFDYEENENGDFCGFVSSSSCQSFINDDMMMLDEIFDEYDQLLKTDNYGGLDSFVDSLLA